MTSRKYRYAIFGVFFVESGILGTWIPRIPDIKEKLGLSDGELGLSLLAMPLGTLIGLFVAAKIIEYPGYSAMGFFRFSFYKWTDYRACGSCDEHRSRQNRETLQQENHVAMSRFLESWFDVRCIGWWCGSAAWSGN